MRCLQNVDGKSFYRRLSYCAVVLRLIRPISNKSSGFEKSKKVKLLVTWISFHGRSRLACSRVALLRQLSIRHKRRWLTNCPFWQATNWLRVNCTQRDWEQQYWWIKMSVYQVGGWGRNQPFEYIPGRTEMYHNAISADNFRSASRTIFPMVAGSRKSAGWWGRRPCCLASNIHP